MLVRYTCEFLKSMVKPKRELWTQQKVEAIKDGAILLNEKKPNQYTMNMFPNLFPASTDAKDKSMNVKIKDKKRNILTKIARDYPESFATDSEPLNLDDFLPWQDALVIGGESNSNVVQWTKFKRRAGYEDEVAKKMNILRMQLLNDMNATEDDIAEFKKSKKCITCDWNLHTETD